MQNFNIPHSRFLEDTIISPTFSCVPDYAKCSCDRSKKKQNMDVSEAESMEMGQERLRERETPQLSQCLPEDQRELWKLTSHPTSHIRESPQNTFHCCLSFWLPSRTPSTLRPPHFFLWPDGFSLTVCVLHLHSQCLGGEGQRGTGAVWTNGFEVAEQIKLIKGNLFTDTPQTRLEHLRRDPDKNGDQSIRW